MSTDTSVTEQTLPDGSIVYDFTALEIELQAKINAAPKPFRDLANWLASKLDSDDWSEVEPLLIAAIPAAAVDVFHAYPSWPEDIRRKLSNHDLRRMGGWINPGTGCGRINSERQRQLHRLGYTVDHDDEYVCGELRQAAEAYLQAIELPALAETMWPFTCAFKPRQDSIENLERAGALIAAEIDRLLRARAKAP